MWFLDFCWTNNDEASDSIHPLSYIPFYFQAYCTAASVSVRLLDTPAMQTVKQDVTEEQYK